MYPFLMVLGTIVAIGLAVATYLALRFGPNIVRTYFARRGLFWAFIGEMSAVIIEKFGKFHRCIISVNLLRYREFRFLVNDRNFKFLNDNGRITEKFANASDELAELKAQLASYDPNDAEKAAKTLEKKFHGELPFILLRADEARDKPINIGLPWEVSIRTVAEIEGQQVAAPSKEQEAQKGFTFTLDLGQRAIFVMKQADALKRAIELERSGKDAPEKKFYMPDVPSRDGMNTALSFSMIVRPHDPYKVVYNIRYWLLTLLNEIVPHIREAIAKSSWYTIAEQIGAKAKTTAEKEVREKGATKEGLEEFILQSILQEVNHQSRLNLGLVRSLADARTAWETLSKPFDIATKQVVDEWVAQYGFPARTETGIPDPPVISGQPEFPSRPDRYTYPPEPIADFQHNGKDFVWWNRVVVWDPEHPGKRLSLERYPEDNTLVLERVYDHYGLYVVDVKFQDVEAVGSVIEDGKAISFLQFLASITGAKFQARALIERATGEAEAIRLRGTAVGDAAREEVRGVSEGIKLLSDQNVDPNRSADLIYMREGLRSVDGVVSLTTGANTVLGAASAIKRAMDPGSTPPKTKDPAQPAGGSTQRSKPDAGTQDAGTTEGGES